jgi:hypothetical protein
LDGVGIIAPEFVLPDSFINNNVVCCYCFLCFCAEQPSDRFLSADRPQENCLRFIVGEPKRRYKNVVGMMPTTQVYGFAFFVELTIGPKRVRFVSLS